MTKLKKLPLVGIIALLSTIVTGSWVADGLKGEALLSDWFPVLREYRLLVTLSALILFIISFMWLYNYRKIFLAVRTLEQKPCEPHSSLILLLSTPNIVPSSFSFPLEITDRNGNRAILNGKSLENDINALNKIRWNWQQLLRGIKPHQKSLKHVYLIGSRDSGKTKGSFGFLNDAENFIRQYCQTNEMHIYKVEKAVDFEDLKELTEFINKGIQKFKEELKISEEDIIIDVTGGQKTTSIAGAVVTLNSQVTFQYVQTNEPYEVLTYDVMIQSPVSS